MPKKIKKEIGIEIVSTEVVRGEIEKELSPMVREAVRLRVVDTPSMTQATEYLGRIKFLMNKAKEQMETITIPAKATVKAAEAVWKPFIDSAKEAIEKIRESQSEYQTKLINVARAEEERIASRVGEGKGKFTPETAIKKMDEIERPEHVDSLTFREMEQFEIVDLGDIPLEYHLANEVKIRAAMKAGIKLKGVKYFTKQVPINK